MSSITNTFIGKLKKQAKAICKGSTDTLTQIQDELARQYGYKNWRTLISHKGRGAVLVADARDWFLANHTASVNLSRIYPLIEEPSDIFDIIASHFDFALEFQDGGRMAELAEDLVANDAWVSDEFLALAYGGE